MYEPMQDIGRRVEGFAVPIIFNNENCQPLIQLGLVNRVNTKYVWLEDDSVIYNSLWRKGFMQRDVNDILRLNEKGIEYWKQNNGPPDIRADVKKDTKSYR
jgi:hypothetical protein